MICPQEISKSDQIQGLLQFRQGHPGDSWLNSGYQIGSIDWTNRKMMQGHGCFLLGSPGLPFSGPICCFCRFSTFAALPRTLRKSRPSRPQLLFIGITLPPGKTKGRLWAPPGEARKTARPDSFSTCSTGLGHCLAEVLQGINLRYIIVYGHHFPLGGWPCVGDISKVLSTLAVLLTLEGRNHLIIQ